MREAYVEHDDGARFVAPQEEAALEGAVGAGAMRVHHRAAATGTRIEPARHIERDDQRAAGAGLVHAGDRLRRLAAGLALGAGAEDAIDDAGGIGRGARDVEGGERLGAGALRVGGARLAERLDGDGTAGAGERAGDDPRIAPVVAGAGEDDGAALAQERDDLEEVGRGALAGGAHEGEGLGPRGDGRGLAGLRTAPPT